jgi:hypothetical protein
LKFVVISGPHVMKKWFANRDKGIFCNWRVQSLPQILSMRVVCIASIKRGGGSHWIWPQCPVHCARIPFTFLNCSISFTYASYAGAENW